MLRLSGLSGYLSGKSDTYAFGRRWVLVSGKGGGALYPLWAVRKGLPHGAFGRKKGERIYVGVQAKEDAIRFSGSSGGMFSILADFILKRGGVVYGAGFNQEMAVVHKGVYEENDLKHILRAKYVQSDMCGIYREVQKHLRGGKWVLFCGTPCQVRAMKLFLRESFPRLILVDLICYGAASPGVWKSYVDYLEQRGKGKLESFSFRNKRNRDFGRSCSYVIDKKETIESMNRNLYCKLYFWQLFTAACLSYL